MGKKTFFFLHHTYHLFPSLPHPLSHTQTNARTVSPLSSVTPLLIIPSLLLFSFIYLATLIDLTIVVVLIANLVADQ